MVVIWTGWAVYICHLRKIKLELQCRADASLFCFCIDAAAFTENKKWLQRQIKCSQFASHCEKSFGVIEVALAWLESSNKSKMQVFKLVFLKVVLSHHISK